MIKWGCVARQRRGRRNGRRRGRRSGRWWRSARFLYRIARRRRRGGLDVTSDDSGDANRATGGAEQDRVQSHHLSHPNTLGLEVPLTLVIFALTMAGGVGETVRGGLTRSACGEIRDQHVVVVVYPADPPTLGTEASPAVLTAADEIALSLQTSFASVMGPAQSARVLAAARLTASDLANDGKLNAALWAGTATTRILWVRGAAKGGKEFVGAALTPVAEPTNFLCVARAEI